MSGAVGDESELNVAPRFVIWAPSYSDKSGGIIALHTLCDRLYQQGYEVKLWRVYSTIRWRKKLYLTPLHIASYLIRFLFYKTGPFDPKFAKRSDIIDSIVIYPEIVSGNPLEANSVVRWLLYHPGKHTGEVSFGEKDLIVSYSHEFDLNESDCHGGVLRVTTFNSAYRQVNYGHRAGSCYLVYKGKGRSLDQHPRNSVKIDFRSHREVANIFNDKKYLYSYDLYSFYNVYAAVCGCIPIIIPRPGLARDEWYGDPIQRFGLAYGIDDISWAEETRPALLQNLESSRKYEDKLVEDFVEMCRQKFF